MSRRKSWFLVLVAVLALSSAACTNDALDDGDGADVIVEVENLDNPPVTASLDQVTGICTFTITDWVFNARAEPKNRFAEGPFNDVAMIDVMVQYAWINPALSTPTRTIGLGGIAIPVGGTATITFQPIAFDDLSLANQSSTANLIMTFRARTVEGTQIMATVSRQLNIEACA